VTGGPALKRKAEHTDPGGRGWGKRKIDVTSKKEESGGSVKRQI